MLNRIATAVGEPLSEFMLRHQDNPPLWLGLGFVMGGGVVLLMIAGDQFLR